MFRVAVLEGGLPGWLSAGGDVEKSTTTPDQMHAATAAARAAAPGSKTKYKATLKKEKVRYARIEYCYNP